MKIAPNWQCHNVDNVAVSGLKSGNIDSISVSFFNVAAGDHTPMETVQLRLSLNHAVDLINGIASILESVGIEKLASVYGITPFEQKNNE